MLRKLHMTALRAVLFTTRYSRSVVLTASGQHPEPWLYRLAHQSYTIRSLLSQVFRREA